MAKLRTLTELADSAHERAARYAPLPKWDPMHAGLVGAVVAALPVMVFMGFARLNSHAFAGALLITIGLGFLAPFLYLNHQKREHYRAWSKEYDVLKVINDAEGS